MKSLSVTIQMKATAAVLTAVSVTIQMKATAAVLSAVSVTIQMKATEQYFSVLLFLLLHKMVLTFESVDVSLRCDHSDESY